MSRTLVIGLSGQVGEALLPGLLKRESRLLALSRQAQAAQPGVEWIVGSLEAMPELPADVDTILSLGPLDAFAAWFTASDPAVSRVIALSSTGRNDKLHSLDPAERELAQCLGVAEGQLFSFEVQFKPNQDAFTATQYAKDFDRAVNLAATYGGAVITVEGHADPRGGAEYNLDLSRRRAIVVRDYLVAEFGNNPKQFEVIGFGQSRLMDPDNPVAEVNRRVEFVTKNY